MPFIGEIRIFAGSTPPAGWALCDGQLLAVDSNTPLFDVIGYRYGGDGNTTFALPDLRGRGPIGAGDGPGLTPRAVGDSGGQEAETLSTIQMPSHTHSMAAGAANGTSDDPAGNVLARNAAGIATFGASADVNMDLGALLPAGGSQPHPNMQPFIAVSYIIALTGETPS
jgi:microcystin-dependent protein